MKIVIIGSGIVGQATAKTLKLDYEFHDPKLGLHANYLDADVVFICTPTEIAKDYIQNLSLHPNVFVRSSIPFTWIQETGIAMYPEFLTERTWESEATTPLMIVLGCNREQYKVISQISKLDMCNAHVTRPEIAALMKVSCNSLASVKIIFMNYLLDLCEQYGLNYDDLVETIKQDPRVGADHLDVPGPDGKRGFGGKCFPENCNVLIDMCGEHKLLKTVLEENDRFRVLY